MECDVVLLLDAVHEALVVGLAERDALAEEEAVDEGVYPNDGVVVTEDELEPVGVAPMESVAVADEVPVPAGVIVAEGGGCTANSQHGTRKLEQA